MCRKKKDHLINDGTREKKKRVFRSLKYGRAGRAIRNKDTNFIRERSVCKTLKERLKKCAGSGGSPHHATVHQPLFSIHHKASCKGRGQDG